MDGNESIKFDKEFKLVLGSGPQSVRGQGVEFDYATVLLC